MESNGPVELDEVRLMIVSVFLAQHACPRLPLHILLPSPLLLSLPYTPASLPLISVFFS